MKATTLKQPFRDLMPAPSQEEVRLLNADIREHGVLEPIRISENDEILSGHRRYEADNEAAVKVVEGSAAWTQAEKKAFVLKANTLRRHPDAKGREQILRNQKLVAGELKDEGKTQKEIAALLGVAQQTVSLWLITTSAGKNQKPKRPSVTSEQIDQVIENSELGDTQRQIAEEVGLSQSAVSKILKKENSLGELPNRDAKNEAKSSAKCKAEVEHRGLDQVIAMANGLSYEHLRLLWSVVECLMRRQFRGWLKKQLRARGRRPPKSR
jgi:predicted transcriptional regulator